MSVDRLLRKVLKPRWRIRHTRSGVTLALWSQKQAEAMSASHNAWLGQNKISPLYGHWVAEKNR